MKIKLTKTRSQVRRRLLFTIMRTFIFLLCTTVFSTITENSFSQQNVMIDQDQLVTVDQVFKIIKKQTDYRFIYPKNLFKDIPKIQLKKGNIKISKLLKQSLSGNNLNYKLTKNNTIIIEKIAVINIENQQQQQKEIRGTVTGSGGEPLPGVNILVKGTNFGTSTDFDGNFTLQVPDGAQTIVVSHLGYKTQEIAVNGQTNLTIRLEEDAASLDKVVLTGYGSALSKDKLTRAISQISQGDFEKQPLFRVDEAIQGRVAGVVVSQNSGAPGRGFRIRIRGINSITSGNDPLYVVDGVIGAEISTLNPSDIQAISVLKDAASTAIYGNQGSNGVVVINTKKGRLGKPKLTFDLFVTSGEVANTIDVLTGSQLNALILSEGGNPTGTSNTDWQDAIFRSSALKNYNLSYSGASENVDYYVSANYIDQEGIITNSGYKRFSLRSNLNAKISDKLKARFNFVGAREEFHNTNLGGNDIAVTNITTEVLATTPSAPLDFTGVDEANQRANSVNTLENLDCFAR